MLFKYKFKTIKISLHLFAQKKSKSISYLSNIRHTNVKDLKQKAAFPKVVVADCNCIF